MSRRGLDFRPLFADDIKPMLEYQSLMLESIAKTRHEIAEHDNALLNMTRAGDDEAESGNDETEVVA